MNAAGPALRSSTEAALASLNDSRPRGVVPPHLSGCFSDGAPQPRYDVRVRVGIIEIRRGQEPGAEAVTPDDIERLERVEAHPAEHGVLLRRGGRRPQRGRADAPLRRGW